MLKKHLNILINQKTRTKHFLHMLEICKRIFMMINNSKKRITYAQFAPKHAFAFYKQSNN